MLISDTYITPQTKPRARDLGIPFEGEPATFNAITDVKGVEVGYSTLIDPHNNICTGITAILPRGKCNTPSPVWAGQYDLNGNGEMTGTHWINEAGYFLGPVCITNTHSVGMVHHATTKWMLDTYDAHFKHGHAWAMPVVAETYDGFMNDITKQVVGEEHVLHALDSAQSGVIEEGNVGGGTGMQTYEFKGGSGTASRVVNIPDNEFVVGVFVQSNFGLRHELNVAGVPVGQYMNDNRPIVAAMNHDARDTGSIVVTIATDAPLLPLQLQSLAKRAAIGLGRTGTSGGHYSGDIFLAFSTANDNGMPFSCGKAGSPVQTIQHLNEHYLDEIYSATVQAVEEAILNAMIAAQSTPSVKPKGLMFDAIDHHTLIALLQKHHRISA